MKKISATSTDSSAAKRRSYYLHTLNGQPAAYSHTQGVCFASHFGPANKLAHSLKQIRAEQAESKARDRDRLVNPDEWRYGYIRVRP